MTAIPNGDQPQYAIHRGMQRWAHDRQIPLNATIEVTQRCNVRCQHCYNFDRDTPRGQGCADPELSTGEILALIGDLKAAGCLFLALTGGEVLVHPDLLAIMDHAANLDLAVTLLSNGVLLRPGMVGQLARFPNLLRVSVSVYGATAEAHDGITQAPGSFQRTWAGIHRLAERGITVKVKFIVMRQNVHQVELMRAQGERCGHQFQMDLVTTVRHDGDRSSLACRITPAQLETALRGAAGDLLRVTRPRRSFTDTSWACNCARGTCAVTATGDVLPCISVPLPAGNVRKQPFAEIWQSSPVFRWIRALRMTDYAQCAPCPHKAWCTRDRGAALTHSGSYTGTDPLVCARAELAHRIADERSDPGAAD